MQEFGRGGGGRGRGREKGGGAGLAAPQAAAGGRAARGATSRPSGRPLRPGCPERSAAAPGARVRRVPRFPARHLPGVRVRRPGAGNGDWEPAAFSHKHTRPALRRRRGRRCLDASSAIILQLEIIFPHESMETGRVSLPDRSLPASPHCFSYILCDRTARSIPKSESFS